MSEIHVFIHGTRDAGSYAPGKNPASHQRHPTVTSGSGVHPIHAAKSSPTGIVHHEWHGANGETRHSHYSAHGPIAHMESHETLATHGWNHYSSAGSKNYSSLYKHPNHEGVIAVKQSGSFEHIKPTSGNERGRNHAALTRYLGKLHGGSRDAAYAPGQNPASHKRREGAAKIVARNSGAQSAIHSVLKAHGFTQQKATPSGGMMFHHKEGSHVGAFHVSSSGRWSGHAAGMQGEGRGHTKLDEMLKKYPATKEAHAAMQTRLRRGAPNTPPPFAHVVRR